MTKSGVMGFILEKNALNPSSCHKKKIPYQNFLLSFWG
jgi:hypothetical protein